LFERLAGFSLSASPKSAASSETNPLTMKKQAIPVLVFCGLSLFWNACNTPQEAPLEAPPIDKAALTSGIQAMEDAYAAAAIAKDADAVVAYYADDAVSYSSFKEPSTGKAAIRQRLADQMASDTSGTTPVFKVLEIFAGDGHITEIGSWTESDAAGVVKDHGTYFSVFRKDGDKWLCIRDISVSAVPKSKPE